MTRERATSASEAHERTDGTERATSASEAHERTDGTGSATSASEAHERTDGTGPAPGWGSLPDDLEADVRRVTERARNLSHARLAAPVGTHLSRAHAMRVVAQQLADTAEGIAARKDPGEPAWRELPELSDLAGGDQLAVVGRDLLAELAECDPGAEVWARGARRTARDVVTDVTQALAATRRLL